MSKLIKPSALAGLALAVVLAGIPSDAVAQDNKFVEERQELMKQNSATVRAVGAYVKEGKGSPDELEQRVLQIASNAEKIPSLFPEGTSLDQLGLKTTGAKPEIWEKRAEFEKAADNLAQRARAFAAVVKTGDKGQIGSAMGDFGRGTCGGCHRTFRAKRD